MSNVHFFFISSSFSLSLSTSSYSASKLRLSVVIFIPYTSLFYSLYYFFTPFPLSSDDYKAIQGNLTYLKRLALNVDLAKNRHKEALDRLAKFERTAAKTGDDLAGRHMELKDRATQVHYGPKQKITQIE